MGLTYVDEHGNVHVGPTGADYRAQQQSRLGGAVVTSPAPPGKQMEGMFEVQQDVWVELRPGVRQKLYRHGTRIPEAEAERLGLVEAKKERAIEDKKAPAPATKRTTTRRSTRADKE